ncbi:hypothetical protein CRG98_017283 [Punica granatum]|uniref:Uncharacterized protein n=1 Tax=Punica granatum TaxID=22663 RepID=A0A2I0K156_PUNGR|nr:hypothetical protein CRG98_017283 [Punica granatum]
MARLMVGHQGRPERGESQEERLLIKREQHIHQQPTMMDVMSTMAKLNRKDKDLVKTGVTIADFKEAVSSTQGLFRLTSRWKRSWSYGMGGLLRLF